MAKQTKTEGLRERIAKSNFQYAYLIDDKDIYKEWYELRNRERWFDSADQILQAFNQWLEEQGASHRVKCSHCSWSQFTAEEVVGMSPCNECNSTGYILEPLRLEVKDA